MLPIDPIQSYSRFRRFIKDEKNNANEESFDQTQKRLSRRLKAIRDGFEPGPLSGVNNIPPEGLEVLNDNSSKRQRYGSVCIECQNTYKKNSYRAREVVLYRGKDKQVEISS